MVAAMAGTAVLVRPPAIARQHRVERGEQVVVAAGSGLEDRQPGRGVRYEHAQQAVLLAAHEAGAFAGQVVHGRRVAGADGEGLTAHTCDHPRGTVVRCTWGSWGRWTCATTPVSRSTSPALGCAPCSSASRSGRVGRSATPP